MIGQKRKFLSTLLLVVIIWAGLFFALQVLAQTEPATGLITVDEMQMEEIGQTIGLPTTDIRLVVARIIRVALGFLGVVALVLILYGGFVWMTAGGNEEKIQKAKKILVNAAIGLAIILSAYAIASFVINALVSATTGGEGGTGGPGGPPGSFTNVLYITSMPGDDLGCGIRNIHPIITFNKAIDISTVPNNLVIRNKQTGAPAEGIWRLFSVDKQNAIVFDPIGDCGVEPPQNDCLDASTTYQIYFVNSSNIKSQDALSLNCNVGNYKLQCKNTPAVEFVTGDSVDVDPPTITIVNPFNNQSFAQGSVIPVEVNYTDNFGVQNVSLYVNGTPIDSQAISGCQKSGTTTLNWPSGTAPTGTYSLESIVFDNAALFASTSRDILLLAGHCFDDQLNFDETFAGPPACGGECGACAGESCTENSDCASGWCEDGFCVDRMRISGFSPTAGAASTTYVSIWGQYFGDDGGHVYFTKSGGDGWSEAFVANCGAGIDNWTNSQIIVKVPPDAITGPIKVETAGTEETKFIDITNNDGWGYQADFTVNDELLPGLCAVVPNYGAPYTNVVLIGENFGSNQTQGQDNVFFVSSTPIIYNWSNNSVTVRVPALGTGSVPVKLMNDNKNSNSVQFNVREVLDSGAPMIESIYPEKGAKGEYITIIGKNFGSYTGKVLFKYEDTEAVYGTFDFPEECEGATWSDKQVVVKFPTSSVQEGRSYKVQIQRSSDMAISPVGATFNLESGNPAPGICKISPDSGPIPFGQIATMQIFGEYYTRDATLAVPYFWLSAADPLSITGRTTTGTISVSNTRAVVQPPSDTETGPVVMYRSTDQKMGNSMPFTVFNCLENNNTCADPAYQCCTAGNDAGICRLNTELCEGQTRSTGYMWRFNTGPFPPTARVVERCNSETDLGNNLPSPSPNIRWSLSENTDHLNVCRTAEVTIEFSMRMLPSTVNPNNIQIYKCSSSSLAGAFLSTVNSCQPIGGPIQMRADSYTLYPATADESADHDYIQMFPESGKWDDDAYYNVVLKTGLMSAPTSFMYGDEVQALGAQNLKIQRPCGAGSAYCFIFKTDARDCRLARVIVTPYAYWTSILEEPMMRRDIKDNAEDMGTDLYYRGTGLSDQKCIMMNMDDYSWDWSVQAGRSSYAELYNVATGTNGNMQQVSALSNTVSVGLLNPEDAANIEATATKGSLTIENGLVSWWNFDGDNVLDMVEDNHGVIQGGATFVNGKINRSIRLNGTDGVVILSNPWLLPDAKKPRSMCAWGSSLDVNYSYRWLVAYGSMGAGRAMFIGRLGSHLIAGGYGDDIQVNDFWQTNVWNHICLTYDGTYATLYANGVQVAKEAKPDWYLVNQFARIGAQIHPTPNEFWSGDIDDVRIYKKSLTPGEVYALYQGLNESDYDQKTGVSPLTIDLSKPRVVDYWPNCLEACTNAEIGARFNIRMSTYNVDNGVKVYKCFDENCSSTIQIPSYDLDIKLGDDSRFLSIVPKATTVDPNPEWQKDTLYLVVLSKTGTNVSDQTSQLWSQKTIGEPSSQGKPMQEAFSWRFRTKSEKCTVDSVSVTPVLYRAPTIDSRKVYSSQARSAPDSCDPEGQLLNAWTLDWDWTSSDILVAEVIEFKTKGKSPFCSANCVKKGSTIVYGGLMEPLCGNMAQEAGEDCDPPQKVGDTVICSLNCLRPGNNYTTTTISYGSAIDYGLCGDGVVSPLKGEKCDPNNPSTSAGCTANCLLAGSLPQTGAEDISASICGNGMIGTGEDCDIGNSSDFWVTTSSLYCSEKCLHLGSSLSSSWCAVNTSTFNGFSASEYNKACANAKSICGDGIVSPDEDSACELATNPLLICTDRCLINTYSDYLKKCSPTTTMVVKDIDNNPLYTSVIKSEGCNSIGQYEGSSLMYSTSSLCGDGVVGIGEDPDCEKNFVFIRDFVDPWALAVGIGLGTTTPNNTQITDITAVGEQEVDDKIYTESGKGQFEILCGFNTDLECQIQTNNPLMGVAENSCCYERSLLIDTYPARTMPSSSEIATAFDVCPNTYIEATFNKVIDIDTLPGGVYVARGYNIATTTPECPVGQIDVTDLIRGYVADARDQIQPWYKRLWAGITGWIKNLFGIEASADTPRSEFNANIYCVGDETGTPSVIVNDPKGVNSTSTVLINLKKPLAFGSDYAIIFRPGVKDVRGVSVGNTAQWQFITGNEICVLDKAEIDPNEHMFNKSGVTQNFEVKSISQNDQLIQPVAGYSWEYDWGPAQNEFIAIANATGTVNVITAKNRNGEVDLTATSRFTENIFPISSPVVTGKSHIVVFLCENRWPSGSLDNFPFIDEEHDFSTYYCMDYGMVGIADDLPNVTTSQIWTPSVGSPYVKRYIFINNNNKDAIGIQIFYNSNHLSISDWYASQGFTGQMNSVKIDGFDALTDGNNYYIDALVQPPYSNQTTFNIYSNIYQFSINSDATAQTKEVFNQIIKNLKFNLRLNNEPYCATDYNGANIDYGMQCSNDMDCLAQMEAIKKVSPTTTKSNYFCYNQKDKLQRNYARLSDLRGMIKTIEWGRGAVAIWPMDYVTYGKLPDSTGRGFEAVINESTGKVSLLSGRISQALHLEQPAYLVATKATDIGDRSFTIAHWIKTTSSQYRAYTISNDSDPNSSNNRYYFGISNGKVGYRISYNGSDYSCSEDNVNDNLWHHIAATFDRKAGQTEVTCYVDGIVSGSASFPSSFISMYEGKPRIGTPICSSVGNCMKCSSSDTSCDSAFKADIDDVRIYARALSAEEMNDLFYDSLPYNGGYPNLPENTYLPGQALSVWPTTWSDLGSKLNTQLPTDPINKMAQSGTCFLPVSGNQYEACFRDVDCATIPTNGRSSYWTADDNIKDEGAISNDAVIEGAVQTVVGKGHGKAFEFAGDSSAKVVAANFDEYNGDNFSVSAWIYPTKRNTATIIKKGGSDEDGNSLGGFILEYSGLQFTGTQVRFNNGTVRFAIFPDSSDSNKYYAIDSQEPLGLNQWYYISATFNKNTKTGKLYINGSLVSETFRIPPNGGLASIVQPTFPYATNTLSIEIGESFNGKIDNIAFYSRDLNATEISNLYAGLCILHDSETGWSAEDRRFSFACNTSSYAYRYSFVSTTQSYLLRANLETLQSPEPQNFFNFKNDFTSNKVMFEYGVCASASEISSPYNVYCGDGILGGTETCDPPGTVSYNTAACPASATKKTCNSQCAWGAESPVTCAEAIGGTCGDGKVQYSIGEVCDDGLLNGQPGRCNEYCTGVFQTCGNGVLDSGEFCDTVEATPSQPMSCAYRPGVETKKGFTTEPVYYFLVDLSGSMDQNFDGSSIILPGEKTKLQYVQDQLPLLATQFAEPETKAKIGIGSFRSTNIFMDYLDPDIKFATPIEVTAVVGAFDGQGGTPTGAAIKWWRENIYENFSDEDKLRQVNLVLVTDGASSGLPTPTEEIALLNSPSYGVLTYVFGVAYFTQAFNDWAVAGGTNQYIPINDSSDSILDQMLEVYYSQPCRQYDIFNAFSCNWNCTGFGGYCGDGMLQVDSGEQCEGTAPVPCTTDGGYSGTAQCLNCQLQECIADSAVPTVGVCGNGIVDEFEACDRGTDENGIICTPIYPQQNCTYCSADCNNVITKDIICGNGILNDNELCDPGMSNKGFARTMFSDEVDRCLPCKTDCTGWDVGKSIVNSMSSGCAVNSFPVALTEPINLVGRGYCGDGIRQGVLNINSATGLLIPPYPWINFDYEECDIDASNCPECTIFGFIKACTDECKCTCSLLSLY